MIYVVLGMHKSGTTLVSKLLHQAGIAMVEHEPDGTYSEGAFYERQACYHVNLRLLGWRDDKILFRQPPGNLRLKPDDARMMQAIIAENEVSYTDWGFKDPRTCLTYSLWAQHLPLHRLIVVFRPVEDIWPRYVYSGWRFWKHWGRAVALVRTWCLYNAAILDIVQQTQAEVLVLSYRLLISDDAEYRRLCDFVGRPLPDVREKRAQRHGQSLILNLARRYVAGTGTQHDQVLLTELEHERRRTHPDEH